MPRVSVVLPVYNGRPYLRVAVDSILAQTLRDIELIVVDDSSEDGSSEILEEYAARDARVKVLRNHDNLGVISSLNRGLREATGEYVARQDADDISFPERLARQVAWLDRHPEVGVLGTDYWRFGAGAGRSISRPPRTHTALRFRLLFGNVWCHPSIMIRRKVLASVGGNTYDPNWPLVEDYELWTRLLRRTRGATLPAALVMYRMHEASVCRTNPNEQACRALEVSAREINRLVPGLKVSPQGAEQMARVRANPAPGAEIPWAAQALLEVFEALGREPGIEASQLRITKRRWVRSVVAGFSFRQLAEFSTGVGVVLARGAPIDLSLALLAYPSRRLSDFIRGEVRSLRRIGGGLWAFGIVKRVLRRLRIRRAARWRVEIDGRFLCAQKYAGHTVLFSPGTSLMGRLRSEGAAYEPELIAAMCEEVESLGAGSVIDVGSNIGLVTLGLLARFPKLEVYAFEPSPHPAELLEATLRYNDLARSVKLHRFALDEVDGTASFYIHDPAHASGDGFHDTGRAGVAMQTEVSTRTLDGWWRGAGRPRISIMKIDTEGAELRILRGAVAFLRACRPTIFLEINARNLRAYPHSAQDVWVFLREQKYQLYDLAGGRLEVHELTAPSGLRGDNFVARPRSEDLQYSSRETLER